MDCQRLRVVFAGTPAFAAVALAALLDSDHDVVGVLSQPDRPSGRGRKRVASAVKALAESHSVPVQQPLSLRDPDAFEALARWQPEVIVVAAYGMILPPAVLELPPLGCINIHASLLPRWRGAAPIHRAILAGDATTGVSIMQMDEGLDTGDVILEARCPIQEDDTSASLHDTLAAAGATALLDALGGFCRGDLPPRAQSEHGVTYASKLHKSEALLDFSRTARELDRQIRGLNPWPVAESTLNAQRVRVWVSRLGAARCDAAPGTVLSVGTDEVEVATGEGSVVLLELQRDGGKRVSAGSLLRTLDAGSLSFGT